MYIHAIYNLFWINIYLTRKLWHWLTSQKPNAELREKCCLGKPRDLHLGQFECSHPSNKRFCMLHCDWGPAQKKTYRNSKAMAAWHLRVKMNTEPLLADCSCRFNQYRVSNMWTRKKNGKIMDDMVIPWKIHVTNHQPRSLSSKNQSGECHWCHDMSWCHLVESLLSRGQQSITRGRL